MAIRLETSKKRGIENHQGTEISKFHLNWAKTLARKHPCAKRRTSLSASYNCHGLIFASRRTRIERSSCIKTILGDDGYYEVPMKDVLPGDIVIYYSDEGEPNHSGVVVEYQNPLVVPIVYSKWGNAGEFVHPLRECPNMYGPHFRFYRCSR